MITNEGSSPLLNKFSLSAPWKKFREQHGYNFHTDVRVYRAKKVLRYMQSSRGSIEK